MIQEYRRSLKMPEAEERVDLIFYRPAGYLLVKAIWRLPVTPNGLTGISLAAGLASALCFSAGSGGALAWGAVLYLVANILDCSDGQLARLQGSGTLLGRVVDGVADYVSSVAVFLGIGLGLAERGENFWPLVVAAGASSALHAILFDQRQGAYISAVRKETSFTRREVEKFTAEARTMEAEGRDTVKVFVLRIYLKYLRLQEAWSAGAEQDAGEKRMIRLWSFLGPSTNRTLLAASALAGRIDLYLWMIVIGGNLWLAFCAALARGWNSPPRTNRPGRA